MYTVCEQHNDGLVELQGIDFPFSLNRLFLKTLPCLTVWPAIKSWRFLLHLNAIMGVDWNTPWNSVFTSKIFQFLFTILGVLLIVEFCFCYFLLYFSIVLLFQFYWKTSVEKRPQTRYLQTLHVYSMPKQRGHNVFT